MAQGILFGLVSALLWATTSLAIKEQSSRIDTLSFNAFRLIIGALFFVALLPFFGGWDALIELTTTSCGIGGLHAVRSAHR